MKAMTIYTDGACRGNPGPGGWGVLLCDETNNEYEYWGAEQQTTNNRMELMAAIEALSRLKEAHSIDLHTDSEYLRKGITQWLAGWKARGWKTASRTPVKNRDLWEALEAVATQHQVRWHWVKGHSGHVENTRVDALANRAIDEMLAERRSL